MSLHSVSIPKPVFFRRLFLITLTCQELCEFSALGTPLGIWHWVIFLLCGSASFNALRFYLCLLFKLVPLSGLPNRFKLPESSMHHVEFFLLLCPSRCSLNFFFLMSVLNVMVFLLFLGQEHP